MLSNKLVGNIKGNIKGDKREAESGIRSSCDLFVLRVSRFLTLERLAGGISLQTGKQESGLLW